MRNHLIIYSLFWCALLLLMAESPAIAASDEIQHHTIHLDHRFQTIDHFTASDAWTTKLFADWSDAGRQHVADLLFSTDKGIGLSMWRFNLGAGLQPQKIRNPLTTTETFETAPNQYDWTRLSPERWMLSAAKARGVSQFLLFVNSPPARMTLNGSTCASPGANSTNLKPDMEPAYARYLADVLDHFAHNPDEKERISFGRVSIFNEPQWEWDHFHQEGTRASNDDIKRVVRLLFPLLRQRKLQTQIYVPESGSLPDMVQPNQRMTDKYHKLYGDYIDSFCADPSVNDMIGKTIGYHSYWSDPPERLVHHREQLARKMKAYPGWSLWQSEYCVMNRGRDLGIATALNVARVIHLDLTVAGASAWGWWLAVSTANYKDGLLYTDWKRKGDPELILPSKTFWAFGNFSRFIRPGMARVGIEGCEQKVDGLMASAYADPSGKRVVVVYVNFGSREARVKVGLSGTGFPLTQQRPYVTTETDDLREMPAGSLGETITLPARSLMTVVVW